MTREELIQHINTSVQHYYSREQVIALINKIKTLDAIKPGDTLTLFANE